MNNVKILTNFRQYAQKYARVCSFFVHNDGGGVLDKYYEIMNNPGLLWKKDRMKRKIQSQHVTKIQFQHS